MIPLLNLTLTDKYYAKIARSEAFSLWRNAKRSIIDIDDVASIVRQLVADKTARNITLNIANPASYPMSDIVSVMGMSSASARYMMLWSEVQNIL